MTMTMIVKVNVAAVVEDLAEWETTRVSVETKADGEFSVGTKAKEMEYFDFMFRIVLHLFLWRVHQVLCLTPTERM